MEVALWVIFWLICDKIRISPRAMTIEKSPFGIGLVVLRVVCSSATVEAKNTAKLACKSNKSRGVTFKTLFLNSTVTE